MTCTSRFKALNGTMATCTVDVPHIIHSDSVYTWRNQDQFKEYLAPKEELPKCRSRYQNKSNGDLVTCDFRGTHGTHTGSGFSWPDKDAYVEGTESTSPTMKQVGGDHYKGLNELQPIDVIDKWKLDFYEGSALKYLATHRQKNGAEDIKKAIHYLQLLLERQYNDGV